ncbi:MAG: hypothetical protein ACREIV_16585, partial [Planctomycetaceae bacterium]
SVNSTSTVTTLLAGGCLLATAALTAFAEEPASDRDGRTAEVYRLADRLELFVDEHRIAERHGVELRLHPPKVMETVLKFDEPWEGPYAGYVTVMQDGDIYRMYYRGWPDLAEPELTCYAQSRDGVHWIKPNLGLFAFEGKTDNNIVWRRGYGSHNFTPFKDPRPGVPADQKFKALGRAPKGTKGLVAFASADGFEWRPLDDEPVLTEGAFDSQNLVFWDPNKNCYVSYFRILQDGVRWIARSEKRDFLNWSGPEPIQIDGPPEHYYTNAVVPYFRAPHYYFAFPKRFIPDRKRLKDHSEKGISEAVFLSSRDGLHFDRTFREALIRPGLEDRNWGDRSN